MAGKKKVLITGAAGLVGGVLRDGLADGYELSSVDIRPLEGDHLQGSMTDLAAVQPAFEGKDVVVDLAAHAPSDTPWQRIYDNNLPSTFNALEAARKAYGRVANGKRPVQALTEDHKVHRDLRKAAESMRQASDQLRGRIECAFS